MTCVNSERNKGNCTCTHTKCPRYGICCECIFYHRQNGGMPGCMQKRRGKDARNQS